MYVLTNGATAPGKGAEDMNAFIGTETYYTGIQHWSRDAVRAIRIGFVIKEAAGKRDTPDNAIVRAYTDEQLEASGGLEPGDRVVVHAWNPDKRCFREMGEVAPVTEILSYLQSRRGRPSELALNGPPALELRVEMGPYRAVVDLDLGSLVIEGPGGFFAQGCVGLPADPPKSRASPVP